MLALRMSQTVERTAIVRVDAEPGGKRFQGVWLELGDQTRWVIAYRARGLWTPFADTQVVVTGHCYRPHGQAINATHFHVDTMRPVDRKDARRFLAVHPEQLVRGQVVVAEAEAGSKAALSSLQHFREDGGTTWWVAGSDERLSIGRRMTAQVRVVEISLSWAATVDGPHVWIGTTYGEDYVPDPRFARHPVACDDD